jgi:quercetin dioxygenase-like cupin family protein
MTDHLDVTDLEALADELLTDARAAGNGRASRTVVGGARDALHQTVIALAAGQELAEHSAPGQATVLVLRGRATIRFDGQERTGGGGALLLVPAEPHSVAAHEDTVLLLTLARER